MFRRYALTLALVCSAAGFSYAAEKLSLDLEKSKIEFVGTKTDGQHPGGFKKFTVNATADMEHPENGSLEILIDADSLWADDEKLTNHLKNPDFFDVRKYPKITFKASKISHEEGEPKAKIVGTMTMLGKESEITVPIVAAITETTITITGDFKIDRTKWGMEYGQGKINNDVAIKTVLVFDR